MEAQLKEKFVSALRSGRYKQTDMKFRWKIATEPKLKYCASGVLFNVISRYGWIHKYPVGGGYAIAYRHRVGDYLEQRYWGHNMDEVNDYGFTYREYGKLINWNDYMRLSFAEIADKVEQEF